ncbi:hypothetical protein [Rhodococcus sp. B10]|uniref:hypothetical protein n=1 Tax=Rhodococcus sp. B10 TaxID=2695876 RepID=UPI0014310CE9|nr:hypothetical protein [Rhodococcus sp. B10]NIL74425.1 hypothetical protein [Rhodococcus sp. B10]
MTKIVPAQSDNNQSDVERTTELDEFVQHMRQFEPSVQPESALWQLYEREHLDAATAVVDRYAIVDKLYPDAQAPHWAQLDETKDNRFPCNSYWQSVPASVPLRRMPGYINAQSGNFAVAHLKMHLQQNLRDRDPSVKVMRMGATYTDSEHLDVLDQYNLTLDEAAHLAHTLLLLLDIAAEGVAENRGAA